MNDRPRIKADTQHLDELIDRARRGRVRIPTFQRGWKWRSADVQALFDSLWQGFPIGTLLLWKRPAPAAKLEYGPLKIDAPATEDAWWVIDGQQRLTSLVASLCHPRPDRVPDKDDPFVVWFDPDRRAPDGETPPSPFFRPTGRQPPGVGAIPVAGLLDAAGFQTWLFDQVQHTGRRDLVERGTELATRLRNYRVPLYEIETEDGDVAREIFLRINRTGRRMELSEVFAAMAPVPTAENARPDRIAERLSALFGPIDANVVARAAHHLEHDGVGDVATRSGEADVGTRETLMQRTEAALRRAIAFLVATRIRHARLLPQTPTVLVTLARFFDRFPEPSPRNSRLLRRWLWRGLFSLGLHSDAKTFGAAVRAVVSDESASVQALLRQVPRDRVVDVPETFDARDAASRLCLLVMSLQEPVAPPAADEGASFVEWLAAYDDEVFTRWPERIVGGPQPEGSRSPAARFLTPGVSPARWRDTLSAWLSSGEEAALRSHLVAADDVLDPEVFVERRGRALARAMNEAHRGLAEPGHDDRPALSLEDA